MRAERKDVLPVPDYYLKSFLGERFSTHPDLIDLEADWVKDEIKVIEIEGFVRAPLVDLLKAIVAALAGR